MDLSQLFSALSLAGVDTQDALGRFMGNRTLYLSFLLRFPAYMDLPAMEQALKDGQGDAFYEKVHSLKGLAGNLSIVPLYELTQRILSEYRTYGLTRPEILKKLLDELGADSAPITELIHKYQASTQGECP